MLNFHAVPENSIVVHRVPTETRHSPLDVALHQLQLEFDCCAKQNNEPTTSEQSSLYSAVHEEIAALASKPALVEAVYETFQAVIHRFDELIRDGTPLSVAIDKAKSQAPTLEQRLAFRIFTMNQTGCVALAGKLTVRLMGDLMGPFPSSVFPAIHSLKRSRSTGDVGDKHTKRVKFSDETSN